MACLSVIKDGERAVVVANPVFVTSPIEFQSGSEMIFEVLEQDAAALKDLVGIGKWQNYVLDSIPFWAQLKFLYPCESIHPGLASLRHKATLRGIFSIIDEAKA